MAQRLVRNYTSLTLRALIFAAPLAAQKSARQIAESDPKLFYAPVVFVGTLLSETRVPTTQSEVSNSCGTAAATFQVGRVLAGTFRNQRGILRYGVNEWCQPEFSSASGRTLVCIYHKTGSEHRFRAEPIYETEQGDVILLKGMIRIGDIELSSLLRPLPRGIPYGAVSQFESDDLKRLVAAGRVISDGEQVSAVQGVFLRDLARSLSDGRWRPRYVSTIVRDGLGGFTEGVDAGRVENGASTFATDEQKDRFEVWDC